MLTKNKQQMRKAAAGRLQKHDSDTTGVISKNENASIRWIITFLPLWPGVLQGIFAL